MSYWKDCGEVISTCSPKQRDRDEALGARSTTRRVRGRRGFPFVSTPHTENFDAYFLPLRVPCLTRYFFLRNLIIFMKRLTFLSCKVP